MTHVLFHGVHRHLIDSEVYWDVCCEVFSYTYLRPVYTSPQKMVAQFKKGAENLTPGDINLTGWGNLGLFENFLRENLHAKTCGRKREGKSTPWCPHPPHRSQSSISPSFSSSATTSLNMLAISHTASARLMSFLRLRSAVPF